MQARSRKWFFVAVLLAAGGVTPRTAQGQTLVGGRVGVYTDAEDFFAGAEVLAPVADRLYVNPNVEYVFANRRTFATFNFDVHYDFPVSGRTVLWAGGGLGILYNNPDGPQESRTDLGANLLFGVGFLRGGPLIPYIQAKVIAADNSDFVVAFGLRF